MCVDEYDRGFKDFENRFCEQNKSGEFGAKWFQKVRYDRNYLWESIKGGEPQGTPVGDLGWLRLVLNCVRDLDWVDLNCVRDLDWVGGVEREMDRSVGLRG